MTPTFKDGLAEAPILAENEWRMENDEGQKYFLYPVIFDNEKSPYSSSGSILVEIIAHNSDMIALKVLENTLYPLGVGLERTGRLEAVVLEGGENEVMVVQVSGLTFTGETITWEML